MIRLLKKAFDVIFVLIIIILSAYFILRYTNQVMIYRVETGSMEDNIHVGDYILIIRKNEYKVGDIITFKKNDGFITHRIIKRAGDAIITKGDANNAEDGTIDKNTIVGKVIIVGGIINFIINYKYGLVGILLSLYLFSCYFGGKDKNEEEIIPEDIDVKKKEKKKRIIKKSKKK